MKSNTVLIVGGLGVGVALVALALKSKAKAQAPLGAQADPGAGILRDAQDALGTLPPSYTADRAV
jgi:hypothetical protein